jgi:hypothetical protein
VKPRGKARKSKDAQAKETKKQYESNWAAFLVCLAVVLVGDSCLIVVCSMAVHMPSSDSGHCGFQHLQDYASIHYPHIYDQEYNLISDLFELFEEKIVVDYLRHLSVQGRPPMTLAEKAQEDFWKPYEKVGKGGSDGEPLHFRKQRTDAFDTLLQAKFQQVKNALRDAARRLILQFPEEYDKAKQESFELWLQWPKVDEFMSVYSKDLSKMREAYVRPPSPVPSACAVP